MLPSIFRKLQRQLLCIRIMLMRRVLLVLVAGLKTVHTMFHVRRIRAALVFRAVVMTTIRHLAHRIHRTRILIIHVQAQVLRAVLIRAAGVAVVAINSTK